MFPEGTTSDGRDVLPFHELAAAADRRRRGPRAADRDPLHAPRRRRRRRAGLRRRHVVHDSFWRVTGERRLVVELTVTPPLPARASGTAASSSREAARPLSERLWRYRRARKGPGTPGDREPDRGQRPPHRQPESSISRFGASFSSSVDQWPQTTVFARRCAVRMLEPRAESGRRNAGPALFAELHRAVGGAEAQPRAGVDDRALAVEARRGRRARCAARRRRAARGTRRGIGTGERRLDLARQHATPSPASTTAAARRAPAAGRPRRPPAASRASQPSSSSRSGAARIGASVSSSRSVVCPAATISRWKSWLPRTVTAASPQRLHLAQHGERRRAAVDEVAGEPQPVALGREADDLQQLAELRVAALDVADGVVAHVTACALRTAGFAFTGLPSCCATRHSR